jgi:hypothetical protein
MQQHSRKRRRGLGLLPNLKFRRGRSRPLPSVPESEDRWFLTDEPIRGSRDDRFRHVDVASLMAEIVQAEDPPGVVGLLGAFGTGKSSVGELLAEHLQDNQALVVVRVSADKHTGIGWQRAFTYDLAEQLAAKDDLTTRTRRRILHPLSSSRQRTALTSAGMWIAGIAAVIYFIGVVVAALRPHHATPWKWPLTPPWDALSLGVSVLTLLGLFKLTDTTPRFEAADEIERVFRELVDRCSRRLILIVDDIDRLPPSQVLEVISTISTLKKKREHATPVIVVTCDESVLRRGLADAKPGLSRVDGSAERAASEYLDRLFTVRLYMPPHLQVNMRNYARELVAARRSAGGNITANQQPQEVLDPVLDILIHKEVRTPRHAIRLLNAFFADFRLAERREGESKWMARREVTDHLTVLARLTVLRVDFPYIYERIAEDFSLLDALDVFAKGALSGADADADHRAKVAALFRTFLPSASVMVEAGAASGPLDNVADDLTVPAQCQPLIRFLRATVDRVARPGSLEPFFYLGQAPHEVILTSRVAHEIRQALRIGESSTVRDHLRAGGGDSRWTDAVMTTIIERIYDDAVDQVGLTNCIQAATEILDDLSSEQRQNVAFELANRILQTAASPAPDSLIRLIQLTSPGSQREQLIQALLTFEEDISAQTLRARAIYRLALIDGADDRQRTALREHFRGLLPDVKASVELGQIAEEWIDEAFSYPQPTWDQVLGEEFYEFLLRLAIVGHDDERPDGRASARRRAFGFARLVGTSSAARPSRTLRHTVRDMLNPQRVPHRPTTGPSFVTELGFLTRMLRYMDPPDDDAPDLAFQLATALLDMQGKPYPVEVPVEAAELFDAWRARYVGATVERADGRHEVEARVQEFLNNIEGEEDEDPQLKTVQHITTADPDTGAEAILPPDALILAELLCAFPVPSTEDGSASVGLHDLLKRLDEFDRAMAVRVIASLAQRIELTGDSMDVRANQAIDALPAVLETSVGRNQARQLAQGWRNRLLNEPSNPSKLWTLLQALRLAYRAVPDLLEGEAATVWERLRELLASPSAEIADIALRGLAGTVWPASLDVEALSSVVERWDQLEETAKAQLARNIASSGRRVSDLPDRMRAALVDHLLLSDQQVTPVLAALLDPVGRPPTRPADRGDVSDELAFLWPVLQPPQRGLVLAMYHATSPAANALTAAATTDEIWECLRAASHDRDANIDRLTNFLAEHATSARHEAALRLLMYVVDGAAGQVSEENLQHVVERLLDANDVSGLYAAIERRIKIPSLVIEEATAGEDVQQVLEHLLGHFHTDDEYTLTNHEADHAHAMKSQSGEASFLFTELSAEELQHFVEQLDGYDADRAHIKVLPGGELLLSFTGLIDEDASRLAEQVSSDFNVGHAISAMSRRVSRNLTAVKSPREEGTDLVGDTSDTASSVLSATDVSIVPAIAVLSAINKRFAAQMPGTLVRAVAALLGRYPALATPLGEAMQGVPDDSRVLAETLEAMARSPDAERRAATKRFATAWKRGALEREGPATS